MWNTNDNNDEMNEKDIEEFLEDRRTQRELSYEQLCLMSTPISEEQKEKIKKWNVFSVSSSDNYEQIFYDIANSKEARRIYRKSNFISIFFCFFIKPLLLFYFIFVCYGSIQSMISYFLFPIFYWSVLWTPLLVLGFIDDFLEEIFIKYIPNKLTGKIDKRYFENKTSHIKFLNSNFWLGMGWVPRFRLNFRHVKQKFKSKYKIYDAINGNEYLVDLNQEGRYYNIRNWYLIAKYITCGKMKITDLGNQFEDDLFVYLKLEGYKKEKLKLWNFFASQFSLNFLLWWFKIIDFFYYRILWFASLIFIIVVAIFDKTI